MTDVKLHELPGKWRAEPDGQYEFDQGHAAGKREAADQLEAALNRAATEMATWIVGSPTVAGVYRVRGFHVGHPQDTAVVEVVEFDGRLMCNLHCDNSQNDIDGYWDDVANFNKKFEWQRIDAQTHAAGVPDWIVKALKDLRSYEYRRGDLIHQYDLGVKCMCAECIETRADTAIAVA